MDEMNSPGVWLKRLFSRERRRSKRWQPASLVAYYWDGAAPVAHRIRDISTTGLYLLTDQRWYPGTVIEMSLQEKGVSDDERDRSIRIAARVIRLGANGVGLAFVLPYNHGSDASKEVNIRTLKTFLRGLKREDDQADIH
jgi:PilZ domain